MNLLGKLQNEYEQIWKSIIRPPRTSYSQQTLGPNSFALEGVKVKREDFQISNGRDYAFRCSLWIPPECEIYPCVVYLHGNNGNRTEGMEYLGKLIKNNIALCTFDFSGCGNAQGEYVTLGYYQQEDLRLVLEYLKNNLRIKDIGLWGRSMGAVTAMMYLGKTIDVKAAIFDSPFRSLKAHIQYLAGKNSKIPMFVLAGALKIIANTIQDKANFSIQNINPLKYSVPGLICPAFFIVSVDDQVIPTDHTLKLFAAYAGENKQLKQVKGKHNDPRSQECVNEVMDFLLKQFQDTKFIDKEKIKKQFDFFEAQAKALQEKDEEQERKQVAEVDFFAEGQATQEDKPIEENAKKGQFTFSGLFSFFSKEKEPKKKETQKQIKVPLKDGYEQTRAILANKFQQQNTKLNGDIKQLRRQRDQKLKKDVDISQGNILHDQQLKQWVYCYI